MRGRTIFVAVLAALSLLCGTAVAKRGHHKVVHGSKHADHIRLGKANDRVFAGGGDDVVFGGGGRDRLRGGRGDDALFGGAGADRLRGGQGDDLLDGGPGDDFINARGDGGDPDVVVCGPGEDTVLLGRNDRIMVEASAANDEPEDGDEQGEDDDRPDLEEPGDDDGCEHVKRPADDPKACDSNGDGCGEAEQPEEPCMANEDGCEDPGDVACVASEVDCEDPVELEPEPGSGKLY